jgi:PAS domain S-box-containing protein
MIDSRQISECSLPLINSTRFTQIITDADGRCLYCNPLFQQLSGHTFRAGALLRFEELIYPSHLSVFAKALDTVRQSPKTPVSILLRHINQQDEGFIIDWELQSMPAENGNPPFLQFTGMPQDNIEKKNAEEQLVRSELFYKNLIADSLDGIILTDTAGMITFASPSVENVLGYRPEELVGHNTFEFVHPGDIVHAQKAFEDEIRMEPTTKFIEARLKLKYGEYVWCNVRGHNLLYNPYVGKMVIYFQDDSFRRQTESALRASENKFREQAMLLNNVTDIIVTTDLQSVITSWNRIAEETTGITSTEANGKFYRDVIPLDFSPYTREDVLATLKSEKVWRGESSFTNRNGKKCVHLHTFSVINDEQGEARGFLVIGKDISERKEIEAKLKESEQFYRNLITNSLDGIVLADITGKVTYCGPSVQKLSGYGATDVIGRLLFDFIHPDDVARANDAFMRELRKESVEDYLLLRLRHSNHHWVWCTVRAHNLLDDPAFNSIAIYFTDDTKRKRIEDRLRDSEERFRHLLDNLATAVVLQDTTSEVVVCNNAAYELLGFTEDQLVGRTSFDPSWNVIREDGSDFPNDMHPGPVAIRTKKMVRDVVMGVYRPTQKDRVWLLANAEPVMDEHEDIIHVICSFTDITEQKRLSTRLMEEEIQKQRLLIQATIDGQEKERKEIGNELHDNINQHLTTTRLYLEVAGEKASGEVREMIQHAHHELTEIFNEIRKLSQSLVPPTLGDIGLVESIQDLTDSLQRIHAFDISFTHESFFEDGLAENLKVMIFRIIQEQVNNIVRHAAASSVIIDLKRDPVQLQLRVSDNGAGFEMAERKMGLGLTNIMNRATLFNGSVEIRTKPQEGCELRVRIPYLCPSQIP